MIYLYLILLIFTAIYLIGSSVMDLRERMIYSFPALLLFPLWGIELILEHTWPVSILIPFWSIHFILYLLFYRFHIWGDGDSDVFLLFASLCLISCPRNSLYTVMIFECLMLVSALVLSILIGAIEGKIKKRNVDKNYRVAVIPGIAIVSIVICIWGLVWRVW